jgi:hypothetical protein
VHAGPAADGRDGPLDLRSALARLRVPGRADLRERRPRRRDQPRDAEDPVRAARGYGGEPGDGRRRDTRAAVALPPHRDREPDRVRGHLPAAGGPARPLLPTHRARLPGDRRRAQDPGRAALLAPARRSPTRGDRRRDQRGPRGRAACVRGRRAPPVGRRARACDQGERLRRDRELRPRQPRARAGGAGVGARQRPQLRHAGGHRAPLRPGARSEEDPLFEGPRAV